MAQQQREVERYTVPDNIAQGMQDISSAQTMGDAFTAIRTNPRAVLETTLQSLGASAPALLESARALVSYDTRERLPEIEIPTLVVWGRRDRLVPVGAAYSYNRRIEGSELHIIEDTGHMVQLERPARFNRTVEEFVAAELD